MKTKVDSPTIKSLSHLGGMNAGKIRTDTEYKKGQITSAQIDQRIAYDRSINRLRNGNTQVASVCNYDGTHQKDCVNVGSDA